MIRIARAVLSLLVVSVGLVLFTTVPASACSCQPTTLRQQVDRADAIFLATVNSAESTERSFSFGLTATRAWKGEVEPASQLETSATTCGLNQLVEGNDYVFFVTGDGTTWTGNLCGGTRPATTGYIERFEQITGAATPIAPPPPPKATLTQVDDAEPTGFARLAAPGGAAVIIGLLGLLVVRQLSRRRPSES